MNTLVGYCTSDSESDTEEISPHKSTPLLKSAPLQKSAPLLKSAPPPKSAPPLKSAQLDNGTSSTLVHQSTFANFAANTEQEKKLDISDDEDAYIPKKKTDSKSTAGSSNIPISSPIQPVLLPKINNLSTVIEKAKIVRVEADNLQTAGGTISAFLPAAKTSNIQETELEQLHRGKRKKREKKKIFVLDLDEFLDDGAEPEKPKKKRPLSSKSTSGLFSILPEPINCSIKTNSTKSVISRPNKSSLMMKPRTIKPPVNPKRGLVPDAAEPDDTDINGTDFFSFSSSQKASSELERAAKSVKLDQYKPKQASAAPEVLKVQGGPLRSIDAITVPQDQVWDNPGSSTEMDTPMQPGDLDNVPADFRDLAFNNADIIDVNHELPSTEEWALKNLDYSDNNKPRSSGKCPLQGNAKRKNQINYLAWQAQERESELKNDWANSRQNRHATQSKYGFR